jgi:hypothetical protein
MGRFIAVLSLLMFFGLVLLIFPPLVIPLLVGFVSLAKEL